MEMKLREGTRGFGKNSRQNQENGFETHTRTEKGERKVNHYVMKLEGQNFFYLFFYLFIFLISIAKWSIEEDDAIMSTVAEGKGNTCGKMKKNRKIC